MANPVLRKRIRSRIDEELASYVAAKASLVDSEASDCPHAKMLCDEAIKAAQANLTALHKEHLSNEHANT